MNIRLMKLIDGQLGRLLASVIPLPPKFPVPVTPESFLLIRPGGIGDAVLLAPVINQLRCRFPDASISVLAERRNSGVFSLIPSVDNIYCYDRPLELIKAMKARYDIVIDTEQWHRLSAVVTRFIRASTRIGFNTNERRRMFDHSVRYSHDDYETTSFGRLLEPLTASISPETTPAPPFIILEEKNNEKISRLLKPIENLPFVVFFTGASIPERRWGADRFRAVAEELQNYGYSIVTVGGITDKMDGEIVCKTGGLNLSGCTSLSETATIIGRSKLLISGDSGILHIAVGLDIPTVSLFGPGRSLKWAPQGGKHLVINKKLSCSPCTIFGTTPDCGHNTRCMGEISVTEVVEAARNLLSPSPETAYPNR